MRIGDTAVHIVTHHVRIGFGKSQCYSTAASIGKINIDKLAGSIQFGNTRDWLCDTRKRQRDSLTHGWETVVLYWQEVRGRPFTHGHARLGGLGSAALALSRADLLRRRRRRDAPWHQTITQALLPAPSFPPQVNHLRPRPVAPSTARHVHVTVRLNTMML